MPVYPYRCESCAMPVEVVRSVHDIAVPPTCGACGGLTRRVFTAPSVHRGALAWEPHLNASVGRVVHTRSEFRSELSRASDEASERTGMVHDFQPIDPREVPPPPAEES